MHQEEKENEGLLLSEVGALVVERTEKEELLKVFASV